MGDSIKKPDHYCEGREYEPKDVIRDWGLNFNLGSSVKYISRAGRKGDILEDLKKARQFLEFEIEAVKKKESKEEEKKRISAELLSRAVTRSENPMKFEDVPESLKSRVINNIAQEVLDSQIIPPDEIREAVIDRIVERINNDELDCFDISYNLYNAYQDIRDAIARQAFRKVGETEKSDIGMTCKEAAEIGDGIAKGFEKGLKEAAETDIEIERKTSWYTNGILGQWYYYQNIPDGYKARVIDKIAQEVLDSQCDIVLNRLTDEVRKLVIDRFVERINNDELDCFDIPGRLYNGYQEIRDALVIQELRNVGNETYISKTYTHLAIEGIITFDSIPDEYKSGVIDRFVERINNGELNRMDIPDALYDECTRIRAAIANSEYLKAMDAVRKCTEDTITISFKVEED